MTNSVSELYEKHPDWIVKAPKRDAVLGRGGTQLVLDLANPKVQDFVFGVVDNLLTKYPEIAYIKWDANMAIMNHGSQYLPMADQSHMYIAYHAGFAKVMDRIRAKYKDVVIQCCASGGGRANWVSPWFRRVLGKRQHRCPPAHLHAVWHQLLLPSHCHGKSYLRRS